MRELRQKIAHDEANGTGEMERLGLELEGALDSNTCYVSDVDSGKTMDTAHSFGGDDKPTSAPARTSSAGAWRQRSA